MKTIVKKIAIYSMIGIMQIGLATSVIEASPRYDDRDHQRYEQYEQIRYQKIQDENRLHEQVKQRLRFESQREWRERQEKEEHRHEQAIRQWRYESEHEWIKRQEREEQRHENREKEIRAGLIGLVIGLMIDN